MGKKVHRLLPDIGQAHLDDPELRAISAAHALYEPATRRVLLQAALLTQEAAIDSVAEAVDLPPLVVEAFAALFHDVLGHKDDQAYRQAAVDAALMPFRRLYSPQLVNPLEQALLHAGLLGTIREVMQMDACIARRCRLAVS